MCKNMSLLRFLIDPIHITLGYLLFMCLILHVAVNFNARKFTKKCAKIWACNKISNWSNTYYIKRLRLGNTTGRQHRFLDYFIPHMAWYLWVYEKYPKEFIFSVSNRASRLDFSDLAKIFQIWPCFGVHEKIILSIFWAA